MASRAVSRSSFSSNTNRPLTSYEKRHTPDSSEPGAFFAHTDAFLILDEKKSKY